MAKGGNNQSSNGSRFTKSYTASNSFVTKVASRVSDYLGGWFGTPLKRFQDAEAAEAIPTNASGDTTEKHCFENVDGRGSTFLAHRIFDDADSLSSPAKRFKVSDNERVDIDFPISPIPGTSGLFQSSNHVFNGPETDDFGVRSPGPSSLGPNNFRNTDRVPQATSAAADVKANGATDNHSDSSESTSGCSSLVPQSDRLSQSVYVGSSRKRNLEKLKYVRQLQQSRLYLNRSIPVNDAPGTRKKPSFDVTVYGSCSLDKSFLREKLINSPFYTGQTSYGGASAYRLSRNAFFYQRNQRASSEKREGTQVQVKPSHHGSSEDLSNMSHTAKKILEALEQFSTPVNDAKRIPVGRANVPLGAKKRRCDETSEARLTLATPASPLNPNPGPVITGLNVPTVPDLLKLKRLERIQNSTAAARQVAVREQEYRLPSEKLPAKRTGKIVTKLKNKEKDVALERAEEVNLPKIPLPITTLPKFDFQLPVSMKPAEKGAERKENLKNQNFVFSPPIAVSVTVQTLSETPTQKKNFTFSEPLNANEIQIKPQQKMFSSSVNFMSSDAVAKLKRKSISAGGIKNSLPPVPTELKTGSVMDFLAKNANAKEPESKSASETWECTNCLIRNINDSKICQGCKMNKVSRTLPGPTRSDTVVSYSRPSPVFGFGDKFKPPIGSWSCKECFVINDAAATKCVACETPKQSSSPTTRPPQKPLELPPAQSPPEPASNGFGDAFKKKADQWECSVCMIRNEMADNKCAACETPKPGAPAEKAQPKFTFGTPLGGAAVPAVLTNIAPEGIKFGIDKAVTEATGIKSAADSSSFKSNANCVRGEPSERPSQFTGITTSVGVFTFGIPPPAKNEKEEPKLEPLKLPKTTETSGNFLVTSTSGSSSQKEDVQPDRKSDAFRVAETRKDVKNSNSPKVDFGKPLAFGAAVKQPNKPLEDKQEEVNDSKPPASFIGTSNSAAPETVSSSTTDFVFSHGKPTESICAGAPLPTLQMTPFGSGPLASYPDRRPADEIKSDSAVSTSAPATTAPHLFAPSPSTASVFNTPPKMTFGATATAPDLRFGMAAPSTTSASMFGHSVPSYTAPVFTSQSSITPSTAPFGMAARASEKASAFGSGSTLFSITPTFGSTANPSPNLEPLKPFATFATNASIPTFGTNPSPTQPFGAGFIQTSTSNKPPFIFGGGTPACTAAPTPAVTAPGVFTFGATQTDPKPAFTFGQSATPGFNFGSSAPAPNLFGGFGQPKSEHPVGATPTVFGSPSIFGQAGASATFETAPPKFDFGGTPAQQLDSKTSPFQFGAAPAQPASAPAGQGFSLSVPQNFNFTGGQPATFSGTSDAESPSVMRRKLIKAVRRTNRDPSRRPQ